MHWQQEMLKTHSAAQFRLFCALHHYADGVQYSDAAMQVRHLFLYAHIFFFMV
jgi:hypothetical protein